jgi:hypothetical protein
LELEYVETCSKDVEEIVENNMVVEEDDDLNCTEDEEGEERRCHGQTHTLFIIVIVSD